MSQLAERDVGRIRSVPLLELLAVSVGLQIHPSIPQQRQGDIWESTSRAGLTGATMVYVRRLEEGRVVIHQLKFD